MEDTKKTDAIDTPKVADAQDNGGDKTFSQDELNKIVSERLNELKRKHEAEKQKAVEQAREEAERLAKLSNEEKEKELTAKQLEALATKEKELAIRENKLKAIEIFDEAKIPIKLVDFVVDSNVDTMINKIELLKESWKTALSEELQKKVNGSVPKDFSVNSTEKKKVVTTF